MGPTPKLGNPIDAYMCTLRHQRRNLVFSFKGILGLLFCPIDLSAETRSEGQDELQQPNAQAIPTIRQKTSCMQ